MTEDDAKTKWCPQFRVATSGGDFSTFETDNRPQNWEAPPEGSPNGTPYRPTGIHPNACCVASACMAWRWLETHVPDPARPGELMRSTRTHGCCGLAGPWFGQMRSFARARGDDVS